MKSAFKDWEELFCFIDMLCNKLAAENLSSTGLRSWRTTAWGSNLEMWGELGLAVRQTKQQANLSSDDIKHDLEQLMTEVHRTWPAM
ncbi:hypothetical protein GCM10011383_39500 [Hymenobacter cavernae]|uniref:Uncharacterized protein n=1 Tax=Hymenobacter cavernae TaxID=2044852 RepID=A0ABQ1UPY2_9BACT|nr:hypothetical protein GCM10011383_39500 [Hymenobacter cavernae]